MATRAGIKITKGGRKGREWVRYLTLPDALPKEVARALKATSKQPRGAAAKGPLGTVTVIPGSTPFLNVLAEDVSVKAGGAPVSNPTAAGGSAAAPTAAQVIADTGQLAAGVYYIEAFLAISGASLAGKHLVLQHRDAANAATLMELALCPAGGAMGAGRERLVVALNERVRVVVGAVAVAAAEVAHAEIAAYKLGA